ncbi:TIGR03936 family radical SAM-associated protein [Marinitoga aeolica]|uniref:DUF2344 domain-containing protein n=1 Tax=Marinitoga aeolica TaxID=2809031 RepID=A0ABY8PS11_9BACT|nr:TIGR03936 family radical SAM-associated protein [Marinitoga aeolica]WGS65429.1 DUF2344 domain-containing protein [Marinitoga aeolica]
MKYLLRFKKFGRSIYISHNDTLEEIERMFRRAKIDLEYTQGFHSKPRLSISQAIPLGYINRVLYVILNTNTMQNFSNFNNYVSEGFKLIEYKSVEDNYKLRIKYYSFRIYISENLFPFFYEKVINGDLKNRFVDLDYEINKNGIYVLKYKQEYNKIYNIWKIFNGIKEDFIFYPVVYDVIWGD